MPEGAFNWREDTYQKLWAGEVPLKRVYFFYGLAVPILLTILQVALVYLCILPLLGPEVAFVCDRIFNLFVIIPYLVLFACFLFNTTLKYQGNILWKGLNFLVAPLLLLICVVYAYGEYTMMQMGYEATMVRISQARAMLGY